MKKATNLVELFQNLNPSKFLSSEDKDLYVPIYDQALKDLRFAILNDPIPNQTYYIAGQTGTGKTTALNFLPNDSIRERFHVENIYTIDLLDLEDIHIVDILLMTCYWLMKREMDLTGKKKLDKKFRDLLKKMEGKHKGNYEEEEMGSIGKEASITAKAGIDLDTKNNPISKFLSIFNVNGSFAGEFRGNYEYRKIIREQFEFNLADLLAIANEVISDFRELVIGGKELLLIFNELDHIRKVEKINNLFIHKRYYLESLECKKVISVPVYLASDAQFTKSGHLERFGLKIKQNPLAPSTQEAAQFVAHCKELLRKVVHARITESVTLIEEDAIDDAIEASGGILRQFIDIMHKASQRAAMADENGIITKKDVKSGIDFVRGRIEPSILGNIPLLDYVDKNHGPPNEQYEHNYDTAFTTALLGNQIIMYYNDPAWYEVNPVIRRTVQIYAKNQSS